jgi:hypothetical protein
MTGKSEVYGNLAVNVLYYYILMSEIGASESTYVENGKMMVLLMQKTRRIVVIIPATSVKSLKMPA